MERYCTGMGPFHGPEPWACPRKGCSLPLFIESSPVFVFLWKIKSAFRISVENKIRFSILPENQIRFSDSGAVGGQKSHKQGVSDPLFVAIRSAFRIFTKKQIRFSISTKSGIRFSICPRSGLRSVMGLRAAGWLHERLPLLPGRPFSAQACPAAHGFNCCLYQFWAHQIHSSRVFCLSPCSRSTFQGVLLVTMGLARKPRDRKSLCHWHRPFEAPCNGSRHLISSIVF